jgi:hypothetical protein
MGERGRRQSVPAAYIGHFSEDPNLGNLRRSKIAVHRFDPLANLESAVEDVRFFRRRHRDTSWQVTRAGADHEGSFSGLEAQALRPVDRLRESSSNDLPADEWAMVAAFIASLFGCAPETCCQGVRARSPERSGDLNAGIPGVGRVCVTSVPGRCGRTRGTGPDRQVLAALNRWSARRGGCDCRRGRGSTPSPAQDHRRPSRPRTRRRAS